MRSGIKSVILAISVITMLMAFVLGPVAPALAQTTPATANLVKRDFSSTDNQHLTASSGNHVVCGDHLCAPGEWTQLQENLNQAQISHSAINSTKTISLPSNATMQISANSTMPVSTNATKIPSPYPVQPTPVPIPTPPSTPSYVCTAVKIALGNSTVSSSVAAKVMSDLGCIS
ncbi:MAG: hypothetical protein KGH87_02985 [Thaumarchaeota archaeon]|nr:hypothetical protein [Nitrososphaerota archaeon]MDE1838864.1 hypothetical protein [Nitrososphaerota archaeon]